MTGWHKNIIMGTVLGGSSIVKPKKGRNCYLFMRSKNLDWMLFKSEELKIFTNGRISREKNSFRWHSNSYPVFCEIREAMYRDGNKRVTEAVLETLLPIGFGVWFGDCGRVIKGRAVLNTHKLGDESTQVISTFFNSMDGFENEIVLERGYLRVQFTPDSSVNYLRLFAEISPPCIHPKFG